MYLVYLVTYIHILLNIFCVLENVKELCMLFAKSVSDFENIYTKDTN